ncbi:MAG: hypothetical protein UU76_C0001G0032 [Parcubacteria group bacterium GW2011_GWC1_41_7]|nr:MAG: hypothetical protein UU76_C0001G0032 [Parcubacteria group bacterium GW2011_GWC1_41_7]
MDYREPRVGEKKFTQIFDEHQHFKEMREKKVAPDVAKARIYEFIQGIRDEIEGLPEMKREAAVHHESLARVSNTLAASLNTALQQGITEGLQEIYRTGNPHLIDAYHDLLAGHFYQFLVKANKIKPQP